MKIGAERPYVKRLGALNTMPTCGAWDTGGKLAFGVDLTLVLRRWLPYWLLCRAPAV
jgi:hypothetical protein